MSTFGDYASKILHDQKASELRAEAARDHQARAARQQRRVPAQRGNQRAAGRAGRAKTA